MPELYDYQKKALAFALEKERCYLALDMGMGKTAISLYWADEVLKTTRGVLVLAPLRTVHTTWPDEIAKWTPHLRYRVLHGSRKYEELLEPADIYIMNYEGIAWLHEALKRVFKAKGRLPFRAVVIDEGSMIKSPRTKRFKTLRRLKDIFPRYRMALSGTPAPNSLLDLWSQYYFLDDGKRLGGAFTTFRSEHFQQVDRVGFVWRIKGPGHSQLIWKAVEDMTYRLDSEDYLDLPERIDNVIRVELPPKIMSTYRELEKNFFLQLEESQVEAFSKAALSSKLRQFMQGAVYVYNEGARSYETFHKEKLKVLKSLVEEADGQGILCAIQFHFELDMIRELFPDAPVIAGGVKAADAAAYIRAWNAGEIPLLLCHPASISHGVNLQSGGHIILWYGLPWSLEHYMQLIKRLHRHGQAHGVIVHHLIAKGTIDERVMRALRAKYHSQAEFLEYLKGVR